MLLLAAAEVVAAGVTHASASKDSELEPLFRVTGGLGVCAGAAAGAPKSKRPSRPEDALTGEDFAGAGVKKPPDADLESCGAAAVVFFMLAVRFANGDGLGGAAGGAFVTPKFSPPKESFRSLNADCCCWGGGIMEGCRGDPKLPMVGL